MVAQETEKYENDVKSYRSQVEKMKSELEYTKVSR